jgi:hypothetical protein
MNWRDALPKNRQRGSFPRCASLMEGDRTTVASRLTKLVGLLDVRVESEHFWMPQGLPKPKGNGKWDMTPIKEAKLGETIGFLSKDQRKEVTDWWLACRKERIPRTGTSRARAQ